MFHLPCVSYIKWPVILHFEERLRGAALVEVCYVAIIIGGHCHENFLLVLGHQDSTSMFSGSLKRLEKKSHTCILGSRQLVVALLEVDRGSWAVPVHGLVSEAVVGFD